MRRALLAAGAATALCACTPAPQAPPVSEQQASPSPNAAPAPKPAEKPDVESENWELPGTLGPLTTRQQLDVRFGKANLREETVPGAEGMGNYPVLVVFPDDPRKRLELVLEGDTPDAPIRELRVRGGDSLWHEASGLRTGMTLAELVALNRAPVSFYGLGWDYGGTVADWHGGTLANGVGSPLFHRVTLATRKPSDSDALPLGDGTFRSDDAKWSAIGRQLIVAELGISRPSNHD